MVYERTLEDVDNFVFDLDGTVWAWNRLKEGVRETLQELRDHGKNLYFITNSALLTREQYAEKLQKMGVPASEDNVLSGSYIASEALDREDIRKLFVIGETGLIEELERNSIRNTEEAHNVLVACDRNLSYWKLAEAADMVRDGARFWATSDDPYWWGGERYLPGTGSITDAIETAADTDPGTKTLLGKPSEYAQNVFKEEFKIRPTNTIILGDSLKTDVVFGNEMGCMTALILGGTATEDDLNDAREVEKPNIVFRGFDRILMKL